MTRHVFLMLLQNSQEWEMEIVQMPNDKPQRHSSSFPTPTFENKTIKIELIRIITLQMYKMLK